MTNGGEPTLGVLAERIRQLQQRTEDVSRRQERGEQTLQSLLYVPRQIQDTRDDIGEIKVNIAEMAKEWKAREQWLEQFRIQAAGLQEGRQQNIRVGMTTTIIIAAGFVTTLMGVLAQVLVRALGK